MATHWMDDFINDSDMINPTTTTSTQENGIKNLLIDSKSGVQDLMDYAPKTSNDYSLLKNTSTPQVSSLWEKTNQFSGYTPALEDATKIAASTEDQVLWNQKVFNLMKSLQGLNGAIIPPGLDDIMRAGLNELFTQKGGT